LHKNRVIAVKKRNIAIKNILIAAERLQYALQANQVYKKMIEQLDL